MSYSLTPLNDLRYGDKVRVCYNMTGKEKYISGLIGIVGMLGNNVTNISIIFFHKLSKKSSSLTLSKSQIVKVYREDEVDYDLGI